MVALEDCSTSAASATFLPPISPQRNVHIQHTADATAGIGLGLGKRFRAVSGGRRIAATMEGAPSKLSSTSTPSLPSLTAALVSGGSTGSAGTLMSIREEERSTSGLSKISRPVPCGETVQMWRKYRKQATGHTGRLERGPRFRSETRIVELARTDQADANLLSWAADSQSAHVLRRRTLRKQLREAKDFIHMSEKRGFVGGPVASEDVTEYRASEQRTMNSRMLRIEGAIRDCSRSRQELVTMQKTLAVLVKEEESPSPKLKRGCTGLREALGSSAMPVH